ncbi:MAG: glycosyltransferase family 2 protein [bacterium]
MVDLTAIVLTKNESKNITECIESIIQLVKRVVVVDSGSTDNTVELAKEYGADVYYHDFEYYAKQFNWAIDNTNITTKWILRLDADERFTPKLCEEVEKLLKKHENDNVNGIAMEAWFYFLGRCMKHGLSNKRKMMIFKNGLGRIEDRKRDAHSIISKGTSVMTHEKFLNYDYKDLSNYIKKYNWYSIREVYDYIEYKNGGNINIKTDKSIQKQRKKKFGFYYKFPKYFRAWLWFVYNYIFKGGFLDGRESFLYHFFECYWYRLLVDAKIFEKEQLGKELEDLKSLE